MLAPLERLSHVFSDEARIEGFIRKSSGGQKSKSIRPLSSNAFNSSVSGIGANSYGNVTWLD